MCLNVCLSKGSNFYLLVLGKVPDLLLVPQLYPPPPGSLSNDLLGRGRVLGFALLKLSLILSLDLA